MSLHLLREHTCVRDLIRALVIAVVRVCVFILLGVLIHGTGGAAVVGLSYIVLFLDIVALPVFFDLEVPGGMPYFNLEDGRNVNFLLKFVFCETFLLALLVPRFGRRIFRRRA